MKNFPDSPGEPSNFTQEQLEDAGDAIGEFDPKLGKLISAFSKAEAIPIVGTIAGIIKDTVLDELVEQNAEMDKEAQLLAQRLGTGTDDYFRQAHETSQALANLRAQLNTAATDTDPIGTQFSQLKEFANVGIEATRKQVQAFARFQEDTLKNQNATPEQILAARQRTGQLQNALDKQKQFINGSALLEVEQIARQMAQAGFEQAASTATTNKSHAIAQNDNLQNKFAEVRNEIGKGQLQIQNPQYLLDQKRIADAEENLEQLKQYKERALKMANDGGATPEALNDLIAYHDQEIAGGQKNLEEVEKEVAQKSVHYLQLQGEQAAYNQQQAEATAAANLASQIAANNQNSLAKLPGDIQRKQLEEQVLDSASAQASALYAKADQLELGTAPAGANQGAQISSDSAGVNINLSVPPPQLNLIIAPTTVGEDQAASASFASNSSLGDSSANLFQSPIISNGDSQPNQTAIPGLSTNDLTPQSLVNLINALNKRDQLQQQEIDELKKQVRELQRTGNK